MILNNKNSSLNSIANYASWVKTNEAKQMGIKNSSQTEVNAFHSLNTYIDDPLCLGFKVFFDFNATSGLFAPATEINSARAYLIRIGDMYRYTLLEKLINQLQDINQNRGYMFQAINGLDIIRQHKPWERYGDDAKITLDMLEDVTFSTQSIMLLYNQIYYDHNRGCEILPRNLRRFSCSVYIFSSGAYTVNPDSTQQLDIAAFNIVPNILKTYTTNSNSSVSSELYVKSPDLFNHVNYDLSECEFISWESQESFYKPSNNTRTFIETNNITFSFRYCVEKYLIYQLTGSEIISAKALFDLAKATDSNAAQTIMDKYSSFTSEVFGTSPLGELANSVFSKSTEPITSKVSDLVNRYGSEDALVNTTQEFVDGAVDGISNAISSQIASRLNSLFLGNVYDWTTVSKVTDLISNPSFNNTTNFIGNTREAKSLQHHKQLPTPNPNIYDKL